MLRSLIIVVWIVLSNSVSSQSDNSDNRDIRPVIIAPMCGPDAEFAACCELLNLFPRACVRFYVHHPQCENRNQWMCCFKLVPGHEFPGDYTHIGIRCRTATKYRYAYPKDICPAPQPPPKNPFQPVEDFFNLKAEEKPAEGEYDCQSFGDVTPDSAHLSSEVSELSPDTSYEGGEIGGPNGDSGLGLFMDVNDQTDIAMSSSAQYPSGLDETSSEINYDESLALGAAGGASVGSTSQDEDIFHDQNILDDDSLVADLNQVNPSMDLFQI